MKQKLQAGILGLALVFSVSGCSLVEKVADKFDGEFQELLSHAEALNVSLNHTKLLYNETLKMQQHLDFFKQLENNLDVDTLELYRVNTEARWQVVKGDIRRIYTDRGLEVPDELVSFRIRVEKSWTRFTEKAEDSERLRKILWALRMAIRIAPYFVELETGSENRA